MNQNQLNCFSVKDKQVYRGASHLKTIKQPSYMKFENKYEGSVYDCAVPDEGRRVRKMLKGKVTFICIITQKVFMIRI